MAKSKKIKKKSADKDAAFVHAETLDPRSNLQVEKKKTFYQVEEALPWKAHPEMANFKKAVNVDIPMDVREQIKYLAEINGVSLAFMVGEALRDWAALRLRWHGIE